MEESLNEATGIVTLTFDEVKDADTFKVLKEFARQMEMDIESEEFSLLVTESLTNHFKDIVE
jgi:hypothetical protein